MNKVEQVEIPVRDLDHAIEFYRDTLGLSFVSKTYAVAFFDCGIRLMLRAATPEAFRPSDTVIYVTVDNIDASVAAIQSRGALIEREPHFIAHMPDHDLWFAFLRDPDGNAIGLITKKPRNSAN